MSRKSTVHTETIGKRTVTSSNDTFSQDPMSQNVMDARVDSGSARYLMNDRTDPIRPPIIIPDSRRTVGDLFRKDLARDMVASTVTMPAANALRLTANDDRPSSMARAAPTLAPLVTPRKSGETSLFLNVSWYRRPERLRPMPTSAATMVRGRRRSWITLNSFDDLGRSPIRKSDTSPRETG